MSAPAKDTTHDQFLQEMVDIISSSASQDTILDRSYYGEALIWPQIYGRKPLIDTEDLDVLREIEESIGIKRILMHDPNVEAHWQRCVDNKEPLTKAQFARARSIYSTMGKKYGFESVTLQQFISEFPDAKQFVEEKKEEDKKVIVIPATSTSSDGPNVTITIRTEENPVSLLDQANAINSILKKRLIKDKGPVFDKLEDELKNFLLNKLSNIFGTRKKYSDEFFSEDEIIFYKAMYKRATEKGDNR